MKKPADSSCPLHELIRERWSPRAFLDRPLKKEILVSILEAGRWAPSCFNEQPWRFMVFTSENADALSKAQDCLVEGNAWAKAAPVLLLTVTKDSFTHNDKPNRHAQHDLGLAVENMVIQAQAHDVSVHQMAGFDAEKARDAFDIPQGYTVMTMIALGYRGEADSLPEKLKEREEKPRTRHNLGEIAFSSEWGKAFAE